jgi:hypothetical protein
VNRIASAPPSAAMTAINFLSITRCAEGASGTGAVATKAEPLPSPGPFPTTSALDLSAEGEPWATAWTTSRSSRASKRAVGKWKPPRACHREDRLGRRWAACGLGDSGCTKQYRATPAPNRGILLFNEIGVVLANRDTSPRFLSRRFIHLASYFSDARFSNASLSDAPPLVRGNEEGLESSVPFCETSRSGDSHYALVPFDVPSYLPRGLGSH